MWRVVRFGIWYSHVIWIIRNAFWLKFNDKNRQKIESHVFVLPIWIDFFLQQLPDTGYQILHFCFLRPSDSSLVSVFIVGVILVVKSIMIINKCAVLWWRTMMSIKRLLSKRLRDNVPLNWLQMISDSKCRKKNMNNFFFSFRFSSTLHHHNHHSNWCFFFFSDLDRVDYFTSLQLLIVRWHTTIVDVSSRLLMTVLKRKKEWCRLLAFIFDWNEKMKANEKKMWCRNHLNETAVKFITILTSSYS